MMLLRRSMSWKGKGFAVSVVYGLGFMMFVNLSRYGVIEIV